MCEGPANVVAVQEGHSLVPRCSLLTMEGLGQGAPNVSYLPEGRISTHASQSAVYFGYTRLTAREGDEILMIFIPLIFVVVVVVVVVVIVVIVVVLITFLFYSLQRVLTAINSSWDKRTEMDATTHDPLSA